MSEKGHMTKRVEKLEEMVLSLDNDVTFLKTQVAELQEKITNPPKKNNPGGNNKRTLFGGKRTKTRVRDKETGIIYNSKSEVGRKMAELVNGDPEDTFVWYKILQKHPGRFEEVSEEVSESVGVS